MEEVEAALRFLTPGCTMKCTLTQILRRRTRRVSMNVFSVINMSPSWTALSMQSDASFT